MCVTAAVIVFSYFNFVLYLISCDLSIVII